MLAHALKCLGQESYTSCIIKFLANPDRSSTLNLHCANRVLVQLPHAGLGVTAQLCIWVPGMHLATMSGGQAQAGQSQVSVPQLLESWPIHVGVTSRRGPAHLGQQHFFVQVSANCQDVAPLQAALADCRREKLCPVSLEHGFVPQISHIRVGPSKLLRSVECVQREVTGFGCMGELVHTCTFEGASTCP